MNDAGNFQLMHFDKSIAIPGYFKSIEAIYRIVAQAAEGCGFAKSTIHLLQVAVWEAFSNIIRHAYGGEGIGKVQCHYSVDEQKMTIVLCDTGKEFKSIHLLSRDCIQPPQPFATGGRGLYLLDQIMDEIHYYRQNDSVNVFVMKKRLPSQSGVLANKCNK